MEDRIFKYAIITSIVIHSFLLTTFWLTDIEYLKENREKPIEVIYQSKSVVQEKEQTKTEPVKGLKEDRKISLPKVLSRERPMGVEPMASPKKPPVKLDLMQKSANPLKGIGEKRQIKVPMLDSDKMMGPRYMNYHQQIRDRIRNRAYFYVDDPEFESGEVYLTFVLASDGRLKEVKVIQERTSANSYLRMIGLRSIKESSPFPPFPRDLDYPELTFNVIISFETED